MPPLPILAPVLWQTKGSRHIFMIKWEILTPCTIHDLMHHYTSLPS
jgi:hypothetical protein